MPDLAPGSAVVFGYDAEAREMAHKAQRFAGEVGSVVWGDHVQRNNGLRSRVEKLEAKLEKFEGRMDADERDLTTLRGELRHYLDAERLATCHGIAALDDHLESHRACEEEETEVKVAEINAGAAKSGAGWQATAAMIGQFLTFAGVVLALLLK